MPTPSFMHWKILVLAHSTHRNRSQIRFLLLLLSSVRFGVFFSFHSQRIAQLIITVNAVSILICSHSLRFRHCVSAIIMKRKTVYTRELSDINSCTKFIDSGLNAKPKRNGTNAKQAMKKQTKRQTILQETENRSIKIERQRREFGGGTEQFSFTENSKWSEAGEKGRLNISFRCLMETCSVWFQKATLNSKIKTDKYLSLSEVLLRLCLCLARSGLTSWPLSRAQTHTPLGSSFPVDIADRRRALSKHCVTRQYLQERCLVYGGAQRERGEDVRNVQEKYSNTHAQRRHGDNITELMALRQKDAFTFHDQEWTNGARRKRKMWKRQCRT